MHLGHTQIVQQVLGDLLALLLHQLGRHRVDQIEDDGEDGEGTVDAQCQPPDELFVLPVPEVLQHQEADRESCQGSGEVGNIRHLGTLDEGPAIEVLGIQSISQIAGD